MNPTCIRKAIGGGAVMLGLLWMAGVVVYPAWQFISGAKDFPGWMFVLAILPVMALPGGLMVYFGVRLFRELTEESLKWVLGTLALFGALWISGQVQRVFPNEWPHRLATPLGLFAGVWLVLPLYFVAVTKLLRLVGGPRKSPRSVVGRGMLTLLAWQLWSVLSTVGFEIIKPDSAFFGLITMVVAPIAVAYGGYRLAAATLLPQGEG